MTTTTSDVEVVLTAISSREDATSDARVTNLHRGIVTVVIGFEKLNSIEISNLRRRV